MSHQRKVVLLNTIWFLLYIRIISSNNCKSIARQKPFKSPSMMTMIILFSTLSYHQSSLYNPHLLSDFFLMQLLFTGHFCSVHPFFLSFFFILCPVHFHFCHFLTSMVTFYLGLFSDPCWLLYIYNYLEHCLFLLIFVHFYDFSHLILLISVLNLHLIAITIHFIF